MPQTDLGGVSTAAIIRSAAFKAGVDDARCGAPARFDDYPGDWLYEWGRQWAFVAPMSQPLMEGRRAHRGANYYLRRAFARGDIIDTLEKE
jgi:hypothetical protein